MERSLTGEAAGRAFLRRFSSIAAPFLEEHLEKASPSCVQEEVVAGKHPQREGNTGLITPRFEIAATHPVSFSHDESHRDELDIGDGSAATMAANSKRTNLCWSQAQR